MNVVGNFKFLGIEQFKGRKDPDATYYNIALLQDMDVVKIFANEEDLKLVKDLPQFCDIQCALNVSIGEKTYVNILSLKKL